MTEAEARREATARLFRSVRAGRSWLRDSTLANPVASSPGSVQLKAGEGSPVFMIPGAPGSVMQLGPVAAQIGNNVPVYAIKPHGFEEGETPFDSLEEMADYGVEAIERVYPEGPCLLAGYSAGGLIALEMARRLAAKGRDVPMLILLDTYPARRIWPLRSHAAILARQATKSLRAMRRAFHRHPMAQASKYLHDRKAMLLWYLAQCGVPGISAAPLIAEGTTPASRRLHQATITASEVYRPAPYEGRVVFLQPEEIGNLKPRLPEQVWGSFLPNMAVRQIPGSHLTMVETDATATAAAITRCAVEVLPAKS